MQYSPPPKKNLCLSIMTTPTFALSLFFLVFMQPFLLFLTITHDSFLIPLSLAHHIHIMKPAFMHWRWCLGRLSGNMRRSTSKSEQALLGMSFVCLWVFGT